jgi:formylglycine-generating enzyme required for sulfatase activity
MGSPASEKEILSKAGMEENSYSAETPHEVRLTEGYWLAETEVTQGQWQVVMGTSLIDQANKALAGDEEYEIGGKKQTLRDIYKMKSGDGAKIIGVVYDRIAMYWISWHEAEDYCNKVSRVVETKGWGLMARLPSEAQWEYACRAGTSKMTYMADFAINSTNNAPGLDPMAWYGGNSSWGYEGQGWDTSGWPEMQYAGGNAGPRRVGQKQANGGGLQDMLGNVWEWCADWYGVYPANATSDPQGNPTGTYRINRGGSWDSPAAACRAAARNWCVPGFRSYNMGFRPVLIPSG